MKSVRRVSQQSEGLGTELEFTARNGFRTVTYRTKVSVWEEAKLVRSDIVPGSGSGVWTGLLQEQSTEWRFAPAKGGTKVTAVQTMKLKGLADMFSGAWLIAFDRPLYKRAFEKLAVLAARETSRAGRAG